MVKLWLIKNLWKLNIVLGMVLIGIVMGLVIIHG